MRTGLYLAKMDEIPPAESHVFSDEERRYCFRRRYFRPHFAGRYAAKRAACIALSIEPETSMHDIEVTRQPGRAPSITLHGEVAQVARRVGATRFHLSISHSGDYAVALVVVE